MPDVFGLLIMAAVAGSWVMIAVGLLPDHEDPDNPLDMR